MAFYTPFNCVPIFCRCGPDIVASIFGNHNDRIVFMSDWDGLVGVLRKGIPHKGAVLGFSEGLGFAGLALGLWRAAKARPGGNGI